MALSNYFPHRCGRNYWDVWDWPQSIFNQHFGADLAELDRMLTIPRQSSGVSEVKNNANKFEVKLDCSHFKPEEITVKTVDNNLIIHGKHEEKTDGHGWVSREFTRRYTLPEGVEEDKVVSALHSDGVLTIEAPKKPLEPIKANERLVPINYVGGPQAIQSSAQQKNKK